MPLESLQSRLVCCIANLKTARLAGLASEGMIMAAVQQHADGSELVVPLQPPGESVRGLAACKQHIRHTGLQLAMNLLPSAVQPLCL